MAQRADGSKKIRKVKAKHKHKKAKPKKLRQKNWSS